MGRSAADHAVYFDPERQVETLQGDMTPADLIDTLQGLRFRNGLLTIKIDKEARNFLVDALVARRGKA
jgi:hypothetical protein